MRIFNELRETTNSPLYRKLYKKRHAGCSYCKWHGPNSENDSWESYHVYLRDENGRWCRKKKKGEGKFPSWKLVSSNKKQWMKKPLVIKPRWLDSSGDFDSYAQILWPMKIRPK